MELPPLALGAVIAATIAAVVSLIGLITGKELKTSEFRQQWIDALRDDISQLLATSTTVMQMARSAERKYQEEKTDRSTTESVASLTNRFLHENKELLVDAEIAFHRILLRINPSEHQALVNAMEDIQRVINGGSIPSVDAMNSLESALVHESQKVLKKEWVRVKRGEPVFRYAKYISGLLLVAGVAAYILGST